MSETENKKNTRNELPTDKLDTVVGGTSGEEQQKGTEEQEPQKEPYVPHPHPIRPQVIL